MAELRRPSYSEPFPVGTQILERFAKPRKSGKPIPVARVQWPNGKTDVVRTNKEGTRRLRFSQTWQIRYYTPDGIRHTVKGYRDRKATETLAAELERRGLREAAGLVNPLDIHAKRPLREHLTDYEAYLTAKGNTPSHVSRTIARAMACLDGARFIKLGDVQPSALLAFLANLRGKGLGITTANYYMLAVKGFTRWLWKDKRAAVDPLAGMSKLANAAADVRRERRDFSPDEMACLSAAALASGDNIRDLTGPDRRMLYLTAAGTGLRVSELAEVRPEDFDLEAEPPTVTAKAAYTKNGQTAVQPLPADLADVLCTFLSSKPSGEPVWPGKWRDNAADLIRRDLAKARAAWLESFQDARQRTEAERSDFLSYCDSEGRYADFHALRHTYISRIVQSGASAKTAQTLARHSTVQLTLGRYAHATLLDLASAVGALPPVDSTGPQAERQALAATGTDGRAKNLAPNLAPQPGQGGDFLRIAETEGRMSSDPPDDAKTPEKQANCDESSSGRGGTRTHTPLTEQGILSPLCLPFHHAADTTFLDVLNHAQFSAMVTTPVECFCHAGLLAEYPSSW